MGRQFDLALGQIFVRMGRSGAFDAVVGHSDEGIPLQHCPACAARFTWTRGAQGLQAVPTGEQAAADELEPGLDRVQIEALVLDWADAIAGDEVRPSP